MRSNIRLEDDWLGRARPYVTGCLSLADPSGLMHNHSPRHLDKHSRSTSTSTRTSNMIVMNDQKEVASRPRA